MNGVVRTPRDPATPPSCEATATITNFKVNLFGFIILWFERAALRLARAARSRTSRWSCATATTRCASAGRWSSSTSCGTFIPCNGFSDPPGLSVTPSGIARRYSLNLPAIAVGIFALTNVSLGAGFNLPFDAAAGVGEVQLLRARAPVQPHRLAARRRRLLRDRRSARRRAARSRRRWSSARRSRSIWASPPAASRSRRASTSTGWSRSRQGSVELAGYVRIHGELSVLALISASLTFNLQLGYLKEGGKSRRSTARRRSRWRSRSCCSARRSR